MATERDAQIADLPRKLMDAVRRDSLTTADRFAIGQAIEVIQEAAALAAPPVEQQAAQPDFWTACAWIEGGGEAGWIPLPGYSNETAHGVKNLVLEAARKEGYKGTVTGRLMELGWEVRPVYLVPQPAPQAGAAEFVGYLCCAWGESDRPVAELVRDLESVGSFMVREWLGAADAQDYDGTPTLPRLMTEWQDHDWDNEWFADFEIGGVSVERLHCTVPAARAAHPTEQPSQDADQKGDR